ncbi:chymotrypsin inhibitor-like [Zeugodacus cucurbitae]|uniref:chymotrypsin inhibitor-like n=1 Tax=Zeugodacus cucurbitae TaxID=28588 RepID=UPI0023D93AFF|nr:chymotrypsin inhibitor-like [Zeugodacus cucurbitae]
MNSKFSLLILLVVCIAGLASAKPQGGFSSCEENEVFTSCGTACPQTCDLRDAEIVCADVCVVGCQCIDGYLRNGEGKCIPSEDC